MRTYKIVLTLEVDQDPRLLTNKQIEELHEEFWACGADKYDMSTSKLEFEGEVVATLGLEE